MSIIDNYKRIEEKVRETALSCGRDPEEIKIISVCKNFPAESAQEAIDSGLYLFGESRIQEAKKKIPLLKGDFSMHMIGHLQSNKAKDAVKLFDLIHSIDKLETAERVNREAEKIGKIQRILIQVNTSGEESKKGATPEAVLNIAHSAADMKNVEVTGLMAMAPFTDDKKIIEHTFKETRELMHHINKTSGTGLKELSMGMSSDFLTAIKEGATMVRIGTAIFGKRNYP